MTPSTDAPLPVGDPAAVALLRRLGGPALLERLGATFAAQLLARTAAAREGLRAGDPSAAHLAGHSLKSSAGQLGARRLQALCARLETLAAAAETDEIPTLLDELEREHARFAAWFDDERAAAAAPAGGAG